jgi:hypothetical protein
MVECDRNRKREFLMNKLIKFIEKQPRFILIAAGVTVALISMILFRDIVRYLIVRPVLFVIYWARIIYETLPQQWWWSLILVVFFFIAIRSLTRKKRSTVPASEQNHIQISPLEMWTDRFEKSTRGGYFKWYLAHEISKLALDVLASKERVPKETAAKHFTEGKFNLPVDVHEYMQTGLDARISFQITELEKRFYFLGRRSILNLETEEMIEFIERKVE